MLAHAISAVLALNELTSSKQEGIEGIGILQAEEDRPSRTFNTPGHRRRTDDPQSLRWKDEVSDQSNRSHVDTYSPDDALEL